MRETGNDGELISLSRSNANLGSGLASIICFMVGSAVIFAAGGASFWSWLPAVLEDVRGFFSRPEAETSRSATNSVADQFSKDPV